MGNTTGVLSVLKKATNLNNSDFAARMPKYKTTDVGLVGPNTKRTLEPKYKNADSPIIINDADFAAHKY